MLQRSASIRVENLRTGRSPCSRAIRDVHRFTSRGLGGGWSVRVGLHHRVIGVEAPDGVLWFWIGAHAEYDILVGWR